MAENKKFHFDKNKDFVDINFFSVSTKLLLGSAETTPTATITTKKSPDYSIVLVKTKFQSLIFLPKVIVLGS